jgi:hypothetical protein
MPFMQKLASQKQTPAQQEQAAASVKLYYHTMKNWEQLQDGGGAVVVILDPWEDLFIRLKEEIRIRQYSPKTLQTYRSWTEHFKKYVAGKLPKRLLGTDNLWSSTGTPAESTSVSPFLLHFF